MLINCINNETSVKQIQKNFYLFLRLFLRSSTYVCAMNLLLLLCSIGGLEGKRSNVAINQTNISPLLCPVVLVLVRRVLGDREVPPVGAGIVAPKGD